MTKDKHNANMKKEEILNKAIEKAVKNGLKDIHGFYFVPEEIIFSHDFAKAFWGTQKHGEPPYKWKAADNCSGCGYIDHQYDCYGGISNTFCWEYHLQQMVLEEDPIKYLERFIK